MLSLFLFLTVVLCFYLMRKQARLYKDAEHVVGFYWKLFYTLAERNHISEEEYTKLVSDIHSLDGWIYTNRTKKEHNKKWLAIYDSLKISPQYDKNGFINAKGIGAKLYENRHSFLQHVESVENKRKRSIEIEREFMQ